MLATVKQICAVKFES